MAKLLFVLLVAAVAEIKTNCVDNRGDCSNMKMMCSVHTKFLKKWCPVTCGFCGGPPIPTNPPTGKPTGFPPVSTNPPSTNCGSPEFSQSRVVGGTTATRGAWPWQILMTFNGRAMCGGSIVSPNWIVTAAHCVSGKEGRAKSFRIRVGEYNRNSQEGTEKDITVTRIVTHPQWNARVMNNDIAMMKVATPIQFNKHVKPVCLPNGDVSEGTKCYITGWGKTRHPGSMTSVLQQTDLPVVSNGKCESLNRRTIPISITNAMICAGNGGATRQSGCHGDSGGPFVCNVGGKWELHGAVSHGSKDCNSRNSYTVFARVNHFSSWIRNNMHS